MCPAFIENLIKTRSEQLGKSQHDLISSLGYSNPTKAATRLRQFYEGCSKPNLDFVSRLAAALQISESVILEAIRESQQQIALERDRVWRTNFKPHCLIQTAKNGRPKQITIAAFTDAMKYVVKEFPPEIAHTKYLPYVMLNLEDWLVDVNNFFFEPVGFVINWSPDSSSAYLLNGSKLCDFSSALKHGVLGWSIK